MNDFWVGGHDAYRRGLQEELREKTAELKKRLEQAQTDAGKEQICREVASATRDAKKKMNEAGGSLH